MRNFNATGARLRRPSVLLIILLGIATSVGFWRFSAADLSGPQASDRQVAIVVSSLMRREHLSKHALDDEISNRALTVFLKSLDPMKVYFIKQDVEEFSKSRDEIDNWVVKGDIRFAYTVFNRFLERVDQRMKLVDELLAQQHDFTVDEEMITDPDASSYSVSDAEIRERWRKRIKYDLLLLKGDKLEGDEAKDKIRRRYQNFARRMHQFDSDDLLETYLTSITSSFDPHTTYMSPSQLENFIIQLGLKLEGIGAQLKDDSGSTVVMKIIPGGAADKHGKLKTEDRIVSVGQGEDGEMVDIVDMKLNDVVKLIRGEAGTVVRLGVIPAGGTETKIYDITRAKIELTDSAARQNVIEEGKKADGSPFRLGVIDLPSFYRDMEGASNRDNDFKSTTRDVRMILDDFKQKGVDAVVLDLRQNGGGSLNEAIDLTGLFIDQGPVVQVKGSDGRVQHYDDQEAGMAWDGPLLVLTSKFSASASEILAGAIQDYRRGLIVGDRSTHGKGTVQSLLEVSSQILRIPNPPNYGALKITVQQFYRPNGDSTQKRGVLADIVLPSVTDEMPVAEADLDYALDFDKVQAAQYNKYNMVDGELLSRLRGLSTERRRESPDFAKLLRDVERYRQQKAKKSITLNEAKYFAQRGELDAEEEEEKQIENQTETKEEVFERNYYNNEVISIALDYIDALGVNKVARAN